MFVKQLYTSCLSEAAYYIESNGEAAIIDPLRDVEEYITLAQSRNATIKYIFETHLHADFISGHIDLSKSTGAPIIYGPEINTQYPIIVAKDGESFALGNVNIIALHTPGHTMESTCYLLQNEQGKDYALFTGDTLFVGDVGRPDLVEENKTKEEMAGLLFESIRSKVLPLADDVIIYPAHGAGSSCGKNIGKESFSTLGEQKNTNYALQQTEKGAFVQAVTEGLTEPPAYFPVNAQINKDGYDSIDDLLKTGLQQLSVQQFKQHINSGALVLDTRQKIAFVNGFVPGSIFIGLEGKFAEWAGKLLPFDKDIVMICEAGKEKESVIRLSRVGFSAFKGYLQGGYESWLAAGEPTDLIIEVEADELAMDIPFDDNLVVVDVRSEVEYAEGHIKNAVNIPLNNLIDPGSMAPIEDSDNLYIHCGSGYRSLIAASLLKRQGIHNLRNVAGGWEQIKHETGLEIKKDAAALN